MGAHPHGDGDSGHRRDPHRPTAGAGRWGRHRAGATPTWASTEGNAPWSPSRCVPEGGRSGRSPSRSRERSPRPDRARLPRHHGRHLRPGLRAHRGVRGGRRQTARLEFLAEASIELARSLDLDVTIKRVARLAVPTFADWCAIDVVRDGRMHRLAVAHVDPRKVELAVALHERWPPDPSSPSGARAVALTGKPELIHEITDEMLVAGCRDAEQLRIARELQLRSALLVPLWVRGRVIGVISWVSTDDHRLYDEDDVRFAEHLARRAATAIDNAELLQPDPGRGGAAAARRASPGAGRRRPLGGRRATTGPPAGPRSGATSTTPSCSTTGATSPSSVTSWAVVSPRRPPWPRCGPPPGPSPRWTPTRRRCCTTSTAWSWRYGSDQLVTLVYVLADATSGHLLVGERRSPTAVRAAWRRVGRAAAVRRRPAARGGHPRARTAPRAVRRGGHPAGLHRRSRRAAGRGHRHRAGFDSARAVPGLAVGSLATA